MSSSSDSLFFSIGLHLSYMNYCATGEGVTSCICVAGSAQRAEHILKEKLHPYFHVGIVTFAINEDAGDDVRRMLELIPPRVRVILADIPRGTGEFYSEFHYNLS